MAASEQWKDFRFWNRLGIGAFLTLIPAVAIAALIAHAAPLLSILPVAVAVIWIGAFIIAFFHLRAFRCPRCNEHFLVKSSFGTNSLGRKCVHCGLELYVDA